MHSLLCLIFGKHFVSQPQIRSDESSKRVNHVESDSDHDDLYCAFEKRESWIILMVGEWFGIIAIFIRSEIDSDLRSNHWERKDDLSPK